MPYMTEEDLANSGFRKVGKNVKMHTKASIYNCNDIEIGDNCRVDDYCVLSGRVAIGRFVHLAPGCLVAGGKVYF